MGAANLGARTHRKHWITALCLKRAGVKLFRRFRQQIAASGAQEANNNLTAVIKRRGFFSSRSSAKTLIVQTAHMNVRAFVTKKRLVVLAAEWI